MLLEAMACGRPALGAANPGYSTVLTGEGRGLLFPPGDSEALQRKIEEFLLDPPLRRWLGERARAYYWPQLAEQVESVYRHGIGKRRR